MKRKPDPKRVKEKFAKFKKSVVDYYWRFKDMRSRLRALSKEATKTKEAILEAGLNNPDAQGGCDQTLMNLLADFNMLLNPALDEAYFVLYNMKNSSFKKSIPSNKMKRKQRIRW